MMVKIGVTFMPFSNPTCHCLDWLAYLAGSSKNHREISISCIFLQSPHQVDMKRVVKWRKDFLLYGHHSRNIPCCNHFNDYIQLKMQTEKQVFSLGIQNETIVHIRGSSESRQKLCQNSKLITQLICIWFCLQGSLERLRKSLKTVLHLLSTTMHKRCKAIYIVSR